MISFWRVLKFGFLNFWRNPWLSIATTLTLALTLFIISIFFFLVLISQIVTKAIEEKMDLVIYIKDEVQEEEILQLEQALKIYPGIKSVEYISKEKAYQIWQTLPTSTRIKQLVTPDRNPLPRSLQVKVEKPEVLEDISKYLSGPRWQSLIQREDISYQKNKLLIKRLSNSTKFVKKIGLILAAVFLIVSVLVIFNTIRLAIISRKDEIEIQRLVGATSSFIQGPFLVEGILYGFWATLISTLLTYLLIHYITPMVFRYLGAVSFNLEQFFISNLLKILLAQFLIGVFVGGLCSLVSVRKYLKI